MFILGFSYVCMLGSGGKKMREVVIVSGARTPVGRFGGAFKDVSAPDLGAAAITVSYTHLTLPTILRV